MRIYVALDVTTEDKRRPFDDVAEVLEEELDNLWFDVVESGYTVFVAGIGRTVRDLNQSLKQRKPPA